MRAASPPFARNRTRAATHSGGVVRVASLASVPALLHDLGADPVRLLKSVGLDPRVFKHPENPIALVDARSPDRRFFAFVMQRVDWQRAGFRKVHTISARAGDDQAPLPSAGISWAQLAERYRRRSAQ